MKKFILIFALCSLPLFSFADTIDSKKFKWMENLKIRGISEINICGDANVLNSEKSLRENFLLGMPKHGLIFSKLPALDEYWKILKNYNKDQAQIELKKEFFKTTLWEISEKGMIKSLGNPTSFEAKFTATIKDCIEGANKTIGGNCTHYSIDKRESCCSEKFVGPVISWLSGKKKITLFYSPDPSVRLRIPGEKSHRYCQVVDAINL